MGRTLTFEDGVLWAAARLVEWHDEVSLAKELLLTSQVDTTKADDADRKYIEWAMN